MIFKCCSHSDRFQSRSIANNQHGACFAIEMHEDSWDDEKGEVFLPELALGEVHARMVHRRSTFAGLMFGLLAGAAWGLAFLIPNMLSSFSSLEITLGRYSMYGLYSLFLFFLCRQNPLRIPSRAWLKALLYAFTGNIGYYFFLVLGIKYAGATVATLIIGTMPVMISFFGNLVNREFPFKLLLIPSCSILAGIFLLFLSDQRQMDSISVVQEHFLLGFLCSIIALGLWTWYGISNANFLKKEPQISTDLFATMVGIQTLGLSVLFLAIGSLANPNMLARLLTHDQLMHYLTGVIVLGIASSWIAAWAWNQTSVRLTVTMAGMVIVFETIFGLLYTFIYERQFPTGLEWGSMIFIVLGVAGGLWRIGRHREAE